MPFLPPNQQRQSTEGTIRPIISKYTGPIFAKFAETEAKHRLSAAGRTK